MQPIRQLNVRDKLIRCNHKFLHLDASHCKQTKSFFYIFRSIIPTCNRPGENYHILTIRRESFAAIRLLSQRKNSNAKIINFNFNCRLYSRRSRVCFSSFTVYCKLSAISKRFVPQLIYKQNHGKHYQIYHRFMYSIIAEERCHRIIKFRDTSLNR